MRRRMMMMKKKSKDDFFEIEVIELSYNSSVSVGKTTAITVRLPLPITIDGVVYDLGGVVIENADYSKVLESAIVLDSDFVELGAFSCSNTAAIKKGRASYASFTKSVKIAESIEYTFYVIAINAEGKRSKPLTITITGQ